MSLLLPKRARTRALLRRRRSHAEQAASRTRHGDRESYSVYQNRNRVAHALQQHLSLVPTHDCISCCPSCLLTAFVMSSKSLPPESTHTSA